MLSVSTISEESFEVKVTWHTAKYGDSYSEFVLWIQSAHTAVNTHPEQWTVVYAAAPGEQLEVQCLAQGHLGRGIEGGESAVHSPTPTYNSWWPETQTHNLWITSLTIRLRLPPQKTEYTEYLRTGS